MINKNCFLLFIDPYHPLNGNIYYHLDYFNFVSKFDKDVKFVFYLEPNHIYWLNKEIILEIAKERFGQVNFNPENIFFEQTKNFNLLKYRSKNIVTTDHTYFKLDGLIPGENIFIFNTWFSLKYKYLIRNKFCTILNESPENGEVNYIRKIDLSGLKEPQNNPNNLFVYISGERSIVEEKLEDIYNKYSIQFDFVLTCQNYNLNIRKEKLKQFMYRLPNCFEQFSTYLYIPPRQLDFAPRLIIESKFLNKNILIDSFPENENGMKRINSVLNNDINEYILNQTDFVIEKLCI